MEIDYFSKASDFLSRVGAQLEKDEAKYGIVKGVAEQLVDNPHVYGSVKPWFCTVSDKTRIHAAAMRTPPHNVLLAHFTGDPDSSARLLVDSISRFSESIPGIVGEKIIADPFVEYWCDAQGVTVNGQQSQQIYRLVKLNRIILAKGRFRMAIEDDKELVLKWAHLFHDEVFASVNRNEPVHDITGRIARKEIFLWEDDVPVSMVAKCLPTSKGMTINYVYTPPELRCRGYATSCVFMVCRDILYSGYEFCTLYTDLANPISNSIYRRIGFKEVSDSVMYTFSIS